MKRDFAQWLLTFTDSIADYKYYIDFETIYRNAEEHKIELNMLNSLIGSKNIEKDFVDLINKYPEILKCIPILLAVRQYEIIVLDDEGNKFEISYDTISPVKIYNPKEVGNIAYQINNNLAKYIDTSYLVKKDVEVPIYNKLVTYKGKHETKTYKSKLSIPSVFDLFSGAINNSGEPFWLIEASKEDENKTYIDTDGTTPFYYKHVGRKVGVKLKVYLDKNAYIKSGDCREEECKIAK